jgi:replicative superfamily II helicase
LSGDSYTSPEEFAEAEFIVATIESFNLKVRKQEEWLKRLSCVVVDEAHMLGLERRGAGVEALLMGLTRLNPACRIILLSATLSNAKDVAKWVKSLNGKTTRLVKSSWRPVKIEKIVRTYSDWNDMKAKVLEVGSSLIDKTLVFVHSKKVGRELTQHLRANDVSAAFYHADLNARSRAKIEYAFRNDPYFNVLVTTSALGMGINL